MAMLNLIERSEGELREYLDESHRYLEDVSTRKRRTILRYIRDMIEDTMRMEFDRNKPLLKNVIGAIELNGLTTPKNIADYCSGLGGGTLRIGSHFPDSYVTGFDVKKELTIFARSFLKRRRKNIRYKTANVYDGPNGDFDAFFYNSSCGPLGDIIIDNAIRTDIPLIAGRSCCFHKFREINRTNGKNDGSDNVDMLSNFAKNRLGLTPSKLEEISDKSKADDIAKTFLDVNRALKLKEKGYRVYSSHKNNILIAYKK
ncbi:hypothetical protein CMI42_00615 [Candidatus Pacearchaeota archaeon]|nr:hypothetical protein [Candidatus Pacearchaeota archaeon]